ncbi:MAG: hypothetical protein HUJ26_21225 [Planctomycetaceae bacterium]|nr:hypothetical protein [Planctomycetaceae bacterium]
MNKLVRVVGCLGLFAAGYWCGQGEWSSANELRAQQADAARQGASQDTLRKIRVAQDSVADAQASLENEQLYVPAIAGTNSFAVMVGGLNAVQDLERGLGVDPETFVGLYAGFATEEVAPKLDYDDEGRLTYDGRLVRLYPKSRLRQLKAQQEKIAAGDE